MSNNALGTVGSLVPGIYYDIISRLTPGFIFLALIVYAAGWNADICEWTTALGWSSSALLAFAAILTSHSAALLLTPIGRFLSRGAKPRAWKRMVEFYGDDVVRFADEWRLPMPSTENGEKNPAHSSVTQIKEFVATGIEDLRIKNPSAARIITKISAEYGLCINLASGILLSLVLDLLLMRRIVTNQPLVIIVLATLVMCCWVSVDFYENVLCRLLINLRLVLDGKEGAAG